MWALCALLVVASAHVGGCSGRLPGDSKIPYVISLSGGARSSGKEPTAAAAAAAVAVAAAAEPAPKTTAAWSLPWLAQRRKGGRKATTNSASGGAKAVPAAHAAASKKVSPTRGFNSALASILGAILLGGGTVSLSPQVVAASPFDPRPPPKSSRKPFFEGWFIRLVDHEQRLSFAVIIGSFRGRGGKELDQHYVSLSYLHEPKGGILPLEVEEEPSAEGATGSRNADGGDKGGGGTGWAGGKSPQARSSEIAKRFSRWIREQRLAVLRGFGAEEEEEKEEIEEEGKVKDRQDGASTDDAVEPAGGAHGDEDVGAVAAEEEGDHREPPGEEKEEPVAAAGTSGESSDTGGRGTEARTFLDPLTPGNDKEGQAGQANGVEENVPLIDDDDKRDSAEVAGDEEEAENDRREVDEDLRDVEGGADLMDAVREPHLSTASGIIEATVRGVGPGESEGEGFAVDVGDVGAAAGEESLIRVGRAEEETVGEEGTRKWTGEDAREGFAVQQSSPSHPETPLQQPPEGDDGPSIGGFAEQEESDERTHTFHAFPPADTVTISCRGEPVDSVPRPRADASFTWEADGIGSFMVDGDTGRLSFQLPELSIAASFRNRQPWSEERPNSSGPEGWLQRTGLLPLHYFVHSMGSEAGYSLKATSAPRAVVGRGSIHMEANYGESFPTGWVWAQGCSATEGLCGNVFRDGELTGTSEGSTAKTPGRESRERGGGSDKDTSETPARFVLTGGRFVIGPVTTTSFVLAFRSKRHNWNFRTTDLDRIVVTVSRKKNLLTLVAKSWGDNRVLKADIHAPEGSFGSAIYVPTPEGFSNAPGCVESYAAVAKFRLYTKGDKVEGDGVNRPLVLREEVEFKLAALEFGGEYQDT